MIGPRRTEMSDCDCPECRVWRDTHPHAPGTTPPRAASPVSTGGDGGGRGVGATGSRGDRVAQVAMVVLAAALITLLLLMLALGLGVAFHEIRGKY